MTSTRIAHVLGGQVAVGSRVTVEGWIRTRRDSKAGLSFLAVHDGSCFEPLQIVAPAELPNYQADVIRITTGCSVRVAGEVVASQGKGQSVEVRADSVEVIGWVDDPDQYPMQPKRHTMEYLREVAHLRPRTNVIGAVTRVRHTLAQAIHRYFHDNDFFWIHTPIITASDAEGAGQMFKVSTLDFANLPRTPDGKIDFDKDFFGRETRLTVSGQLSVETYCMALSRVYTFGPTFRAENSNTRRHLAEFWMIAPEIAFADLAADAQLAEDFLKSIFKTLLVERKDDMAFFEKFVDKECIARLSTMIESKFARVDYTDAIKELEKAPTKFEFPVKWGIDLQSEHVHCGDGLSVVVLAHVERLDVLRIVDHREGTFDDDVGQVLLVLALEIDAPLDRELELLA